MHSIFQNNLSKVFNNFLTERNRREIIIFIFAFTIFINIAFALFIHYFTEPFTGTLEYQEIAKNIALGNGFVLEEGGRYILWRPPLYIYILSTFYYLFENPYYAIVAFQIGLNGLTGVITFLIGERIFSRMIGLFSAILLLGYPLFTYNCLRLMPETLFAFLLSLIVLITIIFFKRSEWKLSLILGFILGLATLSKASIQFFPLFLFFSTLIFLRKREEIYSLSKNLVIIIFMMLTMIIPWTLRNYAVSNEFILLDTSGGYTFWIGNRLASNGHDDDPLTKEEFIEVEKEIAKILEIKYTPSFDVSTTAWASGANSSKLYREGVKNIMNNPFATSVLCLKKLYRFWFSYVGKSPNVQLIIFFIQLPLVVSALFGIYFSFREGKPVFPLVLVILYFSLLHMAATSNVRYTVPIIPYVIILAVYGVNRFINNVEMLNLGKDRLNQ